MKKYLAVIACLLAAGLSPADAAFDWFGGRLSIGGGFGYSKPRLPNAFHDSYDAGQMWTAHTKYYLNDNFSLVASYADLHVRNKTSPNDIHFRPLVGSFRYNIFRNLPISPYLTAGAGVGFNRLELPNGAVTRWNKLAAQGGLGFEFFINQNTSFGAEALYHHFEAPRGVRPYRPISAVGTVNIYFGEGPKTKKYREEAEQARKQAEEAQRQAGTAQEQAASAQQQALTAQQQALTAQQQAASADAARTSAEQRAQEMQAQVAQAQAAVDEVKQMVARKDIPPITFETNKATLLPSSNATLDRVAEIAKKYPTLKLRVEGHTDSTGDDAYNQRLSQQRAEAVQAYLAQAGVDNAQINAVGLGESHPIATNDNSTGRAQNRRVEFVFSLQ